MLYHWSVELPLIMCMCYLYYYDNWDIVISWNNVLLVLFNNVQSDVTSEMAWESCSALCKHLRVHVRSLLSLSFALLLSLTRCISSWWSSHSCKLFSNLETLKICINNKFQQWSRSKIIRDLRGSHCCLPSSQYGFSFPFPPMKITTNC